MGNGQAMGSPYQSGFNPRDGQQGFTPGAQGPWSGLRGDLPGQGFGPWEGMRAPNGFGNAPSPAALPPTLAFDPQMGGANAAYSPPAAGAPAFDPSMSGMGGIPTTVAPGAGQQDVAALLRKLQGTGLLNGLGQ